MRWFLAAVGSSLLVTVGTSPAQDCKWHGQASRTAMAGSIGMLRDVEREVAERYAAGAFDAIRGLSRQAQPAVATLLDPAELAREAMLDRCRNYVRPIRHRCADAARQLDHLLRHLADGRLPDDARRQYASAMQLCERHMGLKPLSTLLRLPAGTARQ